MSSGQHFVLKSGTLSVLFPRRNIHVICLIPLKINDIYKQRAVAMIESSQVTLIG